MHDLQVGEHIQCLDVLKVAFPSGNGAASHDCAILLEVWDQGALLQTSVPIPQGSAISLASIGNGLPAEVLSCEQDRYGYILQIAVREPRWFPEIYHPPHVMWPDAAS